MTMMKLAIAILPIWTNNTLPYALSHISAYLRKAGYIVKVYDFNIKLWHDLNKNNDYWEPSSYYKFEISEYFKINILPKIKKYLDSYIESLIKNDFDIIGFSIFSTSVHVTGYIAESLKKIKPEIKIVYGGPEAKKNSALDHLKKGLVDAIIPGDGEETFVKIISKWENNESIHQISGIVSKNSNGEIIYGPKAQKLNLDELPIPDFSDYQISSYKERSLPFIVSRGCVGACAFCTERDKFRMRSPKNILNEMKNRIIKYGITRFESCDSLINGNHKKLEELVELIIKENMNISWGGSARIDKRLTPDLLKKLLKAGCYWLIFGIESGSNKVLKLLNKGIKTDTANDVIKDSFNAGIQVIVNIFVGFPGEEEEDFNDTLKFLLKNKDFIYKVNANHSMIILENSEVYKNPKKYGVLTDRDGKIIYNGEDGWMTVDKRNRLEIRKKRHSQLLDFLKENNIYQIPES